MLDHICSLQVPSILSMAEFRTITPSAQAILDHWKLSPRREANFSIDIGGHVNFGYFFLIR